MGNPGRPKKPRTLAILDGDRASRVNDAEPVPAEVEVVCPAHLSKPARDVWARLAPDRIAKGVLTAWDVDAFGAFCEALVLLHGTGRQCRDPQEPFTQSPANAFKQAVDICSTLGGRFGWTPSDRAKLSIAPKEQQPGRGAARLLA